MWSCDYQRREGGLYLPIGSLLFGRPYRQIGHDSRDTRGGTDTDIVLFLFFFSPFPLLFLFLHSMCGLICQIHIVPSLVVFKQ